MSYDIYLRDPVSNETVQVAGHLMIGGNYKADYHPDTGTFTPALDGDAHLNITYNYGPYYYEVYEGVGIRQIYGMMGVDSVGVLENMIETLRARYQLNGEWIHTKRVKVLYCDAKGNLVEDPFDAWRKKMEIFSKETIVDRDEGVSQDYWEPTAANAIRPLYQLLALAKMRPDCIWDGD